MRNPLRLALVLAAMTGVSAAPQSVNPPATEPGRAARYLTHAEAMPVLERLAPELAALQPASPQSARDAVWLEWLSRRDADIRARLEQGDEDSVLNLLLFGTSFTRLPRAMSDISGLRGARSADGIVQGRLADLVTAIAAPGTDERLQFARTVVARRGIDPATAAGREQLRAYLLAVMARTAGEIESYARTLDAARSQGRGELAVRSTLYRDRGLSSDTSIRPDFAIHQTLDALRAKGLLAPQSVRRVAVIGPGLDFTDKAGGYDFYPQQITQPFAVIDSLLRLKLAEASRLTMTTIDLSARVNEHLRAARQRAVDQGSYVLVMPRERSAAWTPALLGFWKTAGGSIGDETRAMAAPPGFDIRAVRIRPDVVRSLQVRDLNVVVERLDPLPDGERFDVVVATNILVYYDVFEQSLALRNIASMLRPGGFLLSNNVLVELPTTPIRSIGHTDAVYSDRPDDRDQVVWYQRLP